MSIIPCTEPCVYQAEGNCGLERAASSGSSETDGDKCVHFIEKNANLDTRL